MALAKELGNVAGAGRVFGIHRSTYYRAALADGPPRNARARFGVIGSLRL